MSTNVFSYFYYHFLTCFSIPTQTTYLIVLLRKYLGRIENNKITRNVIRLFEALAIYSPVLRDMEWRKEDPGRGGCCFGLSITMIGFVESLLYPIQCMWAVSPPPPNSFKCDSTQI